jgi:hypothetical protein
MATWPSSLKILINDSQYQPNKHGVRWTTDDGASVQRRTTTVVFRKFTGTVICDTQTKFNTFWNFYTGDAKQGGAWFSLIDPITGSTSAYGRFIIGSEPEINTITNNIKSVNITLEIKE